MGCIVLLQYVSIANVELRRVACPPSPNFSLFEEFPEYSAQRPLRGLLFGSTKQSARLTRNRSSARISEKQEPHHKEHQRDKYQPGKQVDDYSDHEEHDNKDQHYYKKI